MPGDKSISHRYLMLGAIAQGVTSVTHLAPGADVAATIACMRALGVRIDDDRAGRGHHPRPRPRRDSAPRPAPIDAANSGTTMRLLAGILAGCPFSTTMIGDASLSRRPMRRIIEPLGAMGGCDRGERRPRASHHPREAGSGPSRGRARSRARR